MKKTLGIALLFVSLAGFALANDVPQVPEIGPASAASALGLFAGALIVIRSRRKQ